MIIPRLRDDLKPSFCWDRDWTFGEIRRRLRESIKFDKVKLIAWILREGTYAEIWNLVSPKEVFFMLDTLKPFLGRRKDYWSYTFDVWHKLGKV
jgi:hypothetical protein